MKRYLIPTLFLSVLGAPIALTAQSAPPQSAPVPETVISSDRLEMENDGEKSFFLFSDNVKLTGNNLVVTCDRLEVHAERTGDLNDNIGQLGGIRQILAIGNVSISQEGRVATAGRAEVLPAEDKIVLTESPMVTDTQGSLTGERMIFYRGDRRDIEESGPGGKARVVLPAIPDLGFNNEPLEAEEPVPVEEPTETSENNEPGLEQP